METEFCQLWLTCKDKAEATKIAKALLEQGLIACAKQFPVSSDFQWENAIDHNEEVALLMDSRTVLFDTIEAKVKEIHSYDTFVLQAVPVLRTSQDATLWLRKNTNG